MMNIFDIMIIVLGFFGLMFGYRRGMIMQAARLFGFLASLIIAYVYAADVAVLIREMVPGSWTSGSADSSIISLLGAESVLYYIVAFFLLLVLTQFVFHLVARILNGMAQLPGLNLLNRLLGGAFGLAKVALFTFLAVHVLLIIPWSTGQEWVETSSIALWMLEQSPLYDIPHTGPLL